MDITEFKKQNWLRCMHCGHTADLLSERKFICPQCGNLYDVVQPEMPQFIRSEAFSLLKELFNSRAVSSLSHSRRQDPTILSGVWRYKELILPEVPNEAIVTLGEGNSPIVRIGRHLQELIGDVELFLILEGEGPTGSFKDWGGTVMMTVAKLAGIPMIGCVSTGDTSAMTAAYAAAAGIPAFVILPEGKITENQLAQVLAYGAKVILIPDDFDAGNKVFRQLVEAGLVFPANSINPTRIAGHQATVFRIAQFFGWQLPDWIAAPVGNGSNTSSLGLGIEKLRQFDVAPARVLGVQSDKANPLFRSYQDMMPSCYESECDPGPVSIAAKREVWERKYVPMTAEETIASAMRIGNPTSWKKVMRSILGTDGSMSEGREAELAGIIAAAGKDGLLICPQTAVMLDGVRRSIQAGVIRPGSRVVGVSTANGLKFTGEITRGLEDQVNRVSETSVSAFRDVLGV